MNGRKQFSQWLPMLSLSTRYDGPLVTVFVFVFMGLWASFPAKATVHTTASPDTLSERLAQDAMSPLRDIRQVEAGWSHTCALTVDGRVLCWGPDSSIPFVVPELGPGVKAIKAGADHTCAITASGDVACWGRRGTPTRVAGLNETATTLAAGYAHTCALLATDVVKCWGSNTQGQLGDGTTIDRTIPVTVGSLGTDVVAISAAYDNSCALLGSGVVKCWGENGWGQVGDGTTVNRSAPVTVTGLAAGIAAIDVGYSHTCAITGDGKVQCWGNNGAGQLGDGTQNSSSTPVSVIGLATSAKAVSAGAAFTCSITDNDAVFCWGDNSRAALGTDQPFLSTAPVSIAALGSSVAQLSTGWNHACAVMKAGTVICWGENGGGQLGIGLPSYSRVPVGIQLPEITVTAIDTGLEHACALTNTGAVYCWGSNNAWQVNANPTVFYAVPQAMAGLLPGISTLSSGGYHSCALIKGGEVRCWGSNYHGQLGDGTPTTSETPVAVDGLAEPVTALTTGNAHSCALTTSGKALCWGNNDFGQIGDGSGAGQLLPIQVSGLDHGISAISAGGLHSCAIRNGGVLLCWGDNSEGQLGTGTRIGSQIPVTVTSLPEPVKFVSTGEMHT
jgi:alpha-tubulin suppressor-like RCC1 family protein